MNDLIQSPVARNDFQRWLDLGHAPFTIWRGEHAGVILSRLEKNPSVDYLYRIAATQDNGVSWDNSMLFCGVYDMKNRTLYLTPDALRILMQGRFPPVAEAGPSMADEINSRVNRQVEDLLGGGRNSPPRYVLDGLPEAAFLAYIQDPENFVRTEAELHIKNHAQASAKNFGMEGMC